MDTLRTKHPALAFLVSLSVAGTCLAVPGLALADAATSGNGSPSDNAAEVVEAAKPLDDTEKAAVDADAAPADDAAADRAADKQAPGRGGKDGSRLGNGADTKDIKVNGATVTFAGISVDVPMSFEVMDIHHVMAVAVAPTGEMSVTIAAPDLRALAADGGTADLGYFNRVVSALCEAAGVATPDAEEVQLADGVTAYRYVIQLTEVDDGETELEDQINLVFVPVDDSYAVVQVTVDDNVVDVAGETVDAIISSIRITPATDAATDVAAETANDAAQGAKDIAKDAEKAAEGVAKGAEDAVDDVKDEAEKVVDDAKADTEKAADDAKADAQDAVVISPAADASGSMVSVSGMTFVLPENLVSESATVSNDPVWSNTDEHFTVSVKSAVSDDVTRMTTRDLDQAALKMAASMDGEVIGTALFDNDAATVYMYAIVFHEADQAYVGTLGFIPMADNTLNVLTARFPLDQMDTFAPIIESMYESVSID